MTTSTNTNHPIRDERISSYGRLVVAQRRLHRIFDRSLRSQVGISIVWYEALLRLARTKDQQMPINELGDALELTSGGATRLVDRLEESGYLERVRCPTDRRILWARLTDDGLQMLAAATKVHLEDLDESFVSLFTADEMNTLNALLRRVRGSDDG
jgi:DNA-binding MarR family transcriptional regulator